MVSQHGRTGAAEGGGGGAHRGASREAEGRREGLELPGAEVGGEGMKVNDLFAWTLALGFAAGMLCLVVWVIALAAADVRGRWGRRE